MEFVTAQEFDAAPATIRNRLSSGQELVVTDNGKPAVLLLDVSAGDFEETLDVVHRLKAMALLRDIQTEAIRSGLDSMSLDEINAEINAARKERREAARI
ncbi:MAG: prevent-host-death protein [Clostridiales Family XIII bacterium]|jgi:PHD/YefM family antitoxin component YafN of YafNO toxin-antitoxin module|nr:prevent-host-death protein [Clostridiales Family XIII bacterium]